MNKKINLLFLILYISLGIQIHAQVHVDRWSPTSDPEKRSTTAVKFGMKVGVNLSTMSGGRMNFDPGFGMGAGFRIGAVANIHWGQRNSSARSGTGWFGLQPELMYSYQTVKAFGSNIKMNYIQLPVMLKVYPLSTFSIEVGPEFNYLASTSFKHSSLSDVKLDLSDCKGFNVGLGLGAAYEFPMGLMFGARYSLGFTDIAKNLKWKNNGNLQITAGWLF